MQETATPAPLTRRAIREAERAVVERAAVAVLGRFGSADETLPVAPFTVPQPITRAQLHRGPVDAESTKTGLKAVATAVASLAPIEMALPKFEAPAQAAVAGRWVPRVAVLGAIGAATIVAPMFGGDAIAATAATKPTDAASPAVLSAARAAALTSTPSVVDTLTAGAAPLAEAEALTADPTAASRAVASASRAYQREALECTVDAGANGAISAVLGAEEQAEQVIMPVSEGSYRITSRYGYRSYPIRGVHEGTDFAGALGTPLRAVADGVVTYAGGPRDGRSGNIIVIRSEVDGQTVDFWYGHMYASGVFVEVGQEVEAGEVVGEIGNAGRSTGPHLHFEVHPGGGLDAVDSLAWLQEHGAKASAPNC